jgi:hypothetical protein
VGDVEQTVRGKYGLKKLPPEFDREHELFQTLEVEWMPVWRARGYSYTLCCTRNEYKQRKIEGSLPKGAPCKFARHVFSVERRCIVGERTILCDTYKDTGVILRTLSREESAVSEDSGSVTSRKPKLRLALSRSRSAISWKSEEDSAKTSNEGSTKAPGSRSQSPAKRPVAYNRTPSALSWASSMSEDDFVDTTAPGGEESTSSSIPQDEISSAKNDSA